MSDDSPDSLGDQNTFDGSSKPADRGPQSLGDEATLGGGSGSDDGLYDDYMEVVDLESRYTIEGTLGKGGMGEVLLATDTRLNRKVAIKRILGSAARSKTAVNRFLSEAQSIAALNHPNIVQIYDYGRAKDGPFLIMEYVEGSSLLDRCRESAIPVEEAIELACQLCDGLEKAHAANIVHRDIKPANVLLTPDGIPKLTDFGLAKAETADTGMTMAGAVLGTLDFMPPEQRRDAAEVDARSDLWALAATFYQMVTGKSPKIIKFNDVPKSFHDVLGKALEDEKEDRYQTARDFRDALKASQLASSDELELEEGDCPHCGKKNPATRKFCRSCAESLEVPCLSCSTNIPMWEEVCDGCGTKQGELLEQARKLMASNQSEAENLLKGLDFDGAKDLAVNLRDEPDIRLQHFKTWADGFLPQIEKGREQEHLRIGGLLEEALAHRQAHDYAAGLRALQPIPSVLTETAVNGLTVGDLRTELQSTLDEAKRLERVIREGVSKRKVDGLLPEIEKLQTIQPPREDLEKLHKQLTKRKQKNAAAVASILDKARLLRQQCQFEAAEESLGQITEELRTEKSTNLQIDCQNLGLSKNEAIGALSKAMQTEDYQRGLNLASDYRTTLAEEGLTDGSFNQAYAACQSALKGKQEAAAATKRQKTMVIGVGALVLAVISVGLYLAAAAAKAHYVKKALNSGDYRTALQLAPANTQALSMKKSADIKEGIERTVVTYEGHTKNVTSVAYSPDGKSIVSGGGDGTIRIWDTKTGKERLFLKGGLVLCVAYSPDGNSIVSGSWDKTIKIWDAKTGEEKRTLKGHTRGVSSVAFSPDGNSIVSGSDGGTLKIWDAKTGREKGTIKVDTRRIYSVAYSPDGNSIVSGSSGGTLKIWDAKTGEEKLTLRGHKYSVYNVACSPDGNSIVSGSWDKTIKIWDTKTGEEKRTLKGHTDSVQSIAFSPDGNSIVSGSDGGTLKIWDAKTGEEKLTLKGHRATVYSVAFSPDGNGIVSGSGDRTVKIWDVSAFSSQ